MFGLSFDIARRYLFGKKSTNSINIITGISVVGIAIGTAALVLILSVFNGFEGLLSGLFNAFNPDIKVMPIEGKYFECNDSLTNDILLIEGIEEVSKTIEEVAQFEYKGIQEIGIIKGVDQAFKKVSRLDTSIVSGRYLLQRENIQYAILGQGMRNKLSLNIDDRLTPVTIYMPTRKKKLMGAKEYNSKHVYPAGIFSVRSDNDYQYIITSLELASKLLEQKNKISYLEIKLSENADQDYIQAELSKKLGSNFEIKNRYRQDEATLKVMQIEKWISFLITGLTMLLIAFNLLGALWMIIIEKKKDISVLKSMGYSENKVKTVFLILGMMITGIGILIGFVLALILYFIQKEYGIIGVPASFLIDSYPIQLRMTDFLVVTATVAVIGCLISLLPAQKASKSSMFLRAQ